MIGGLEGLLLRLGGVVLGFFGYDHLLLPLNDEALG